MKKKFNIIVLASGNGTALGAIIEAIKSGALDGLNILGVISNRNLGALEKARNFGTRAVYIPTKNLSIYEYNDSLVKEIEKLEGLSGDRVDLICLVGYMKILSTNFIRRFGKIINVHPALLPKFGGRGMYGDHVYNAVLKSSEVETGMTIHYVDEGVDTGEILLQKKILIDKDDNVESLKKKVQELEKQGYVEVLKSFINSKK